MRKNVKKLGLKENFFGNIDISFSISSYLCIVEDKRQRSGATFNVDKPKARLLALTCEEVFILRKIC